MAKNSVRKAGEVLAKNLIVENALGSLLDSLQCVENPCVKQQAEELAKSVTSVLSVVKINIINAMNTYNEAVAEENKATENLHKAVFTEEK